LPRIKSAKKRVEVAERNRQRNVQVKSAIRTAIKKSLTVSDGAQDALSHVYGLLDRAVSKGILHKNAAARQKSRVTKAALAKQAS